ncbi:hypothetical protein [Nocardia vulneris]|uniref:hypothetical protein n=1 Tax=Nocardia vulneris TaxID=1141657 RepID=UPI000AB31FED|nr:hypothetical protein [Nocardia vulneris]
MASQSERIFPGSIVGRGLGVGAQVPGFVFAPGAHRLSGAVVGAVEVVAGGLDAGGLDVGGPDVGGLVAGGPDVGGPDVGGPDVGGLDVGGLDRGGPLGTGVVEPGAAVVVVGVAFGAIVAVEGIGVVVPAAPWDAGVGLGCASTSPSVVKAPTMTATATARASVRRDRDTVSEER